MSRLSQLHAELGERLVRLEAELESMTEEQRRFRPEPGAWSPLQVAQHLYLSEEIGVASMERLDGRPSGPRSLKTRIGYFVTWVVLRLGLRVKNPVQVTTPEADVTLDVLVRDWRQLRSRLAAMLERLPESGPQQAAFRHPIAGPLSVEEALHFLRRHLDHHLRQIGRIRRHPRFPAAGDRSGSPAASPG